MKTLTSGLATHYAQNTTSLAYLLLITRTDSQVFAFTSHQSDLTVSGQVYSASQGLAVTSLVQTAGLSVDNMDLMTINDHTLFTDLDIFNGVWRNATFTLSKCNWANVADGVEVLLTGTLGEITTSDNTLRVELRGLQQYLQQPVGIVTSKTCRARLGDSSCTKDLTSFTHSGSVTSVTSNQVFTDSTKAQASDYFGAGYVQWLTGANAGLKSRVKQFASGQFTLTLPVLSNIAIGDTFTAVAGCRLRFAEDCVAKFSNGINFQGEPHLPGVDAVTSSP